MRSSRAHRGRRHAVGIFCLIAQLFAGTGLAVGHRVHRGKSKGSEPRPSADPASTSGLLLLDKTTYNNTSECKVEEIVEGVVNAVGADHQVTVVGEVFLGKLLCDTLASAEDAPVLRFAISPEEVWAGEVVYDDNVPFFRTVSMSWGTLCNVETFLVKVTTVYENGTLSLTKSVPCIPNEDVITCFVEVELEPEEEDDSNMPVEGTDIPNNTRLLRRTNDNLRRPTPNREAGGSASVPRKQESAKTKIDVMMLFNEGGKDKLGGISDAQMQTTLATALGSSNEALVHSGINLEFSLVHVGPLPYNELSTSSSTVLDNLGQNKDVAELRDAHGADLVQLVGDIGCLSCGHGNHFSEGDSLAGFSVVNPICLDYFSHTHEFGHNLGCYPNREDAEMQTQYAHGYQDCSEDSDPFRTIMAYSCTPTLVPRVNLFSNPEVSYLGNPTGTATEDCARQIMDNMVIVSHFREYASQYNPTPTTLASNPIPSTAPLPTSISTIPAPPTTGPESHAPRTLAPTTPASLTPTPTKSTLVTAFPSQSDPSTPTIAGIAVGTPAPSTVALETLAPFTPALSTVTQTTQAPSTLASSTLAPTTSVPTTPASTTLAPTTLAPTNLVSKPSMTFPVPVTNPPSKLIDPTMPASTKPIPITLAPITVNPATLAPSLLSPHTPEPVKPGLDSHSPSALASSTPVLTTASPITPAPPTPVSEPPELVTVSPTTQTPTTPVSTTPALPTPTTSTQTSATSTPLGMSTTPAPPEVYEKHPCPDSALESGLVLVNQSSYKNGTGDCEMHKIIQELVDAVQADDMVTVIGEVLLGTIMCESLAVVERAPFLRFAISPEEMIVAEGTSFSVLNGEAFTDGIERKVWAGKEVNNDFGAAFFRTVSMSWAKECNVETFLLKVTTNYVNGTLSVAKSVPCLPGETIVTCFLEVELEPEDEEGSYLSLNETGVVPENTRLLRGSSGYQERAGFNRTAGVSASNTRRLESALTTIDVMMLFNEGGKEKLGGISDAQMQTTLAVALSSSNEALAQSGINLEFTLVYVGLVRLPYNESGTTSSVVLDSLVQSEDVAALRDAYGADLVQLAGDIGYFSCGRGYLLAEGEDLAAFSVVSPICLDYFSHTHEFGHNLGCYHDRDNAEVQTEYAHGYQDCSEEVDPFRTIMSYTCTPTTVPRINWFSNPNISYSGRPTGTATEDCARSIMDNMVTVSNFRDSVSRTSPAPTTLDSTTPMTPAPTTATSRTQAPSTLEPTTPVPITLMPITTTPSVFVSDTPAPTIPMAVATASITPTPTTLAPVSPAPATGMSSTQTPSSVQPTSTPITTAPTTKVPVTYTPTTLARATLEPRTPSPVTALPITPSPKTPIPVNAFPATPAPSTPVTTGIALGTMAPSKIALDTSSPFTPAPSDARATTQAPNTLAPTTPVPTTPVYVTPSPIAHLPSTPINALPITPTPLSSRTPAPVSDFFGTPTSTAPVTTSFARGTLAPSLEALFTSIPLALIPSTANPTTQAPNMLLPTKPTLITLEPMTSFPKTLVPPTPTPTIPMTIFTAFDTPVPSTDPVVAVSITNAPSKRDDPMTPVPTKLIAVTPTPITASLTTLAPGGLATRTPGLPTPVLATPSPSSQVSSTTVLTTAPTGTPAPTTPEPETPTLVTVSPTTSTPLVPMPTTLVFTTPAPRTQAPTYSAPLKTSTPAPSAVHEEHSNADSAFESGLVLFNQTSYEYAAGDRSVQEIIEELVDAVQADDKVTVVGEVLLGKLMCESFAAAEDAPVLRFAISQNETIVAEETSYSVVNGEVFTDGIQRKVWSGREVNYTLGAPYFRTVSMSWATECHVETFLIKVTTNYENGTLSLAKSVPCLPGESIVTCFLEVELSPEEEEESSLPVNRTAAPENARRLRGPNGYQEWKEPNRRTGVSTSTARRLESENTTIDVMMLFDEGGKEKLGGISDAQMQTTLASALSSSNEAFAHSGIDLEFSLVYVGLLPYKESETTSSVVLDHLGQSEDVAGLRDAYGADLVQLAGDIGYFSCGRGYIYSEGDDLGGFSIVNPICLDYFSHTHEFGHNLGCYHNRENAEIQTKYAHGYQDCSEEVDPFRTIMSYTCTPVTVPRVNWFSNPNVSYLGRPTGTATEDCARNIMENMITVSSFRESMSQSTQASTPSPTTSALLTGAPTTSTPSTAIPTTQALSTSEPTTSALFTPPATPAPSDGSSTATELPACLDEYSTSYRCNGRLGGSVIDLNRCQLKDEHAYLLRACFEEAASDLSSIEKIKLNQNDFTTLPGDLLDGMTSLSTLNLQQNCRLSCVPHVKEQADLDVILTTGCNIGAAGFECGM